MRSRCLSCFAISSKAAESTTMASVSVLARQPPLLAHWTQRHISHSQSSFVTVRGTSESLLYSSEPDLMKNMLPMMVDRSKRISFFARFLTVSTDLARLCFAAAYFACTCPKSGWIRISEKDTTYLRSLWRLSESSPRTSSVDSWTRSLLEPSLLFRYRRMRIFRGAGTSFCRKYCRKSQNCLFTSSFAFCKMMSADVVQAVRRQMMVAPKTTARTEQKRSPLLAGKTFAEAPGAKLASAQCSDVRYR
mmetsp:Transcript_70232/g.184100  ORF Transcript_70232/g.184100 Transcript_70232/m.184100 type:complete len:248 (+) Transcript_70232:858-1601(+)